MRSAVISAVCRSKSAKGESAVAIPTLYFALMSSIYPPEQRIPEGLRRLQVLLPFEIVVETRRRDSLQPDLPQRSKVVIGTTEFIDEGGLERLPASATWSEIN